MIELNESCFNETGAGLKIGVPFLQPEASLPNKIDHASSETIMDGPGKTFPIWIHDTTSRRESLSYPSGKILPNYFRM